MSHTTGFIEMPSTIYTVVVANSLLVVINTQKQIIQLLKKGKQLIPAVCPGTCQSSLLIEEMLSRELFLIMFT